MFLLMIFILNCHVVCHISSIAYCLFSISFKMSGFLHSGILIVSNHVSFRLILSNCVIADGTPLQILFEIVFLVALNIDTIIELYLKRACVESLPNHVKIPYHHFFYNLRLNRIKSFVFVKENTKSEVILRRVSVQAQVGFEPCIFGRKKRQQTF